MDAKSRANFINSIGGENTAPVNEAAGTTENVPQVSETVAVPDAKQPSTAPIPRDNSNTVKSNDNEILYDEPNNAFALGVPEWSIEPPQVVVRRKKKI